MKTLIRLIPLLLCAVAAFQAPGLSQDEPKETGKAEKTAGGANRIRISEKIGLASDLLRVSPLERRKLIGKLKPLGSRVLRETFLWNLIEPTRDNFRWKGTDDLVDATKAAGHEILAIIMAAPAWAGGRSVRLGAFPPDDPGDFGNFVKAVVSRYKGRIKYYELWNEPNMKRFWGGKQAKPEDYVALMKAGYKAGKEADPDALFVMGGVTRLAQDPEFLQGVLDAGGLDACDVVGVHIFPDSFEIFREQMKILIARLDKKKAKHPIWLTEVGWTSRKIDLMKYIEVLARRGITRAKASKSVVLRRAIGLVYNFNEEELFRARNRAALDKELAELGLTWGELDKILGDVVRDLAREQVTMLRALSRFLEKEPRIERVFWYRFEDRREGLSKDANFGLIDVQGQPKNSYRLMAGELDESFFEDG